MTNGQWVWGSIFKQVVDCFLFNGFQICTTDASQYSNESNDSVRHVTCELCEKPHLEYFFLHVKFLLQKKKKNRFTKTINFCWLVPKLPNSSTNFCTLLCVTELEDKEKKLLQVPYFSSCCPKWIDNQFSMTGTRRECYAVEHQSHYRFNLTQR